MLRLRTSSSAQAIRAATLVEAATLGEGIRDFIFNAFLRVARYKRPPLATPNGKCPPHPGDRVWVPIDWSGTLSDTPSQSG